MRSLFTPRSTARPLAARVLPVAAVSIAAALTLSACGNSDTADSSAAAPDSAVEAVVTLENCGRTITLAALPARAVTLNQGATESALSVGAQEKLIGTAYLDDEIAPQWADAYAKIPVIAEEYPSREALLELNPDLVLASYATAFGDKEGVGTRESLDDLGIATYMSPFACEDKAQRAPASWDSIASEITDYGTLFGTDSQLSVTEQQTTLDVIMADAVASDKKIFWFDSGTDTPFVGGAGGGPQLIIDAVGGKNIFASVDNAWGEGNWETVLQEDPDVIVLADASWDTADDKIAYLKNDPALRDLTAVKNDAFVVVPFSTTTPGPRTVEGARLVAEQLN